MGIFGRLRFWRNKTRRAHLRGVLRAAVSGASTGEMVELTARALLDAAQAERVGVWLISEETPECLEGTVVESSTREIPREWGRLDRSPFLEKLLGRGARVVKELQVFPEASALGPLAGMRSATGIPLRLDERALGFVLVAFSAPRTSPNLDALCVLADELALAVGRRRAQAAVQRAHAELLTVLDGVESGVLLDTSGRIRFANARLAQLLGFESGLERDFPARFANLDSLASALEGRLPSEVLAPPGGRGGLGAKLAESWRALRLSADEPLWEEFEVLVPVRRVVQRVGRPVKDSEGGRLGWLEVFRDVTQPRPLPVQMIQTEKMAALGQLVSGIVHELNNPLTSIMGYAQLLLARRPGPDRLADVHRVYQEAERARRIVNNLLFFARGAKPERQPVELNEIVERTLALRSYELKVQNILVDLDLAPRLPPVLADAPQMQQVMLNLVVNAEQAILSRPDETSARREGRIRIRTRAFPGNRVVLEVADDDPGIPPEIASRIFDPFFTTKPYGEGTGLGLSIAYGIVQEHGGEIYLDTQRPREFSTGATFVVELPALVSEVGARPEPSGGVPAVIPRPARGHEAGRESVRVLVVEDEPTVAQLIADVLKEEGYRVEAVLDSQEGLARVLRQPYDLVICDLKMPRLDGRAFYQALVHADSPVRDRLIFITGDTLAPRTLEFLDKNHLPYLAKPFLVEELKSAVNRVLELRAPGRGVAAHAGPEVIASDRSGRAAAPHPRREVLRKR